MRALPFLIVSICVGLFSCGGSVGQSCKADTDCDNGQTCLTSAPEGYCTKGCSLEGSVIDCPRDTVCAAHAGRLYCSALCTQQSDCRAGYECNGVGASQEKACRPKS